MNYPSSRLLKNAQTCLTWLSWEPAKGMGVVVVLMVYVSFTDHALRENTILGDERLLYFGIARRWGSAPA